MKRRIGTERSDRGQALPIVIVGLAAATTTGLLGHEHYENERLALEVAQKREAAARIEQQQRQTDDEIRRVRDRMAEGEQQARELKVRVESLVEENHRVAEENAQLRTQVADLQQTNAEHERRAAALREQFERSEARARSLQDDNQKLRAENQQMVADLEERRALDAQVARDDPARHAARRFAQDVRDHCGGHVNQFVRSQFEEFDQRALLGFGWDGSKWVAYIENLPTVPSEPPAGFGTQDVTEMTNFLACVRDEVRNLRVEAPSDSSLRLGVPISATLLVQ